MKRAALALIFVAAGAVLLYVALRKPDRIRPVYRFADAAWRARIDTNAHRSAIPAYRSLDDPRTDTYPVASMGDDTRYLLGSPPTTSVMYGPQYQLYSQARVSARVPLPPELEGAKRVALAPQVQLKQGQYWSKLPDSAVEVEQGNGGAVLPIDIALPSEATNTLIGVQVDGTWIDEHREQFQRTPPVEVPRGAYLAFSIGVSRGAWSQGPVAFRVRACAGADCELLFERVLDPTHEEDRGWYYHRVPLDKLAGRTASFAFETQVLSNAPGAYSLPLWANPTIYARARSAHNDLNIILISIDTLSAKHLPTYGYEFDTAPFIDQVLAKEGVVFDRCVAAATTTPQAHMSMFTSVQPCVHGVVNGLEVVTGKLTLLAEVLRAAGYETGAVTEDAWLACERGFGRGFNDCMENKSPDIMLVEGQIGLTLARAREWVQRNADMSFFLFVHTYQVHEPYAPPDEYRDLFRVRDGQEVGDDAPRGTSEVVGYDQEIRYTDDELRKFVDFLRDQKLLDRTAIVLTSDHGEEFAEHGFRRHGPTLYDEVTRVPLILWGPSLLPRGKRVTETVGHIDLMPTILDIAGLAAPTGASGMSLLPLARGEAGVPPGPRYTEARVPSALNKDYEQVAFTPPAFLVETGLHKLSRYNDDNGFRYEFYDLGTDTGERNNRFSDGSAPVVQLQGLVDAYESGCRAAAVRLGSEAKEAVTLDPANMEKLRALGYVR